MTHHRATKWAASPPGRIRHSCLTQGALRFPRPAPALSEGRATPSPRCHGPSKDDSLPHNAPSTHHRATKWVRHPCLTQGALRFPRPARAICGNRRFPRQKDGVLSAAAAPVGGAHRVRACPKPPRDRKDAYPTLARVGTAGRSVQATAPAVAREDRACAGLPRTGGRNPRGEIRVARCGGDRAGSRPRAGLS